jgi:hypothetical protein
MDPRECPICLQGLYELVPGEELPRVRCNHCGHEVKGFDLARLLERVKKDRPKGPPG